MKTSSIKKLANLPVIGRLVRFGISTLASRQMVTIARHFAKYLKPVLANDPDLKCEVFKIRHNVYCEELKFEPEYPDGMERDEFDNHSHHCLIQHIGSDVYAGTVRVVYSKSDEQLLPIEKYCSHVFDNSELTPSNFPREKICEISRLAVPASFRRRNIDKFSGAATGSINIEAYSEQELRCFPFIAVGLYFAAAVAARKNGIEHCFVMMEPRLARSLKFVGINFAQLGPTVDYHGKRAPFYINEEMLEKNLTSGFANLYQHIAENLK